MRPIVAISEISQDETSAVGRAKLVAKRFRGLARRLSDSQDVTTGVTHWGLLPQHEGLMLTDDFRKLTADAFKTCEHFPLFPVAGQLDAP